MSETVAVLKAELAAIRDERDYLRQTVDRLLATNAMLVQRDQLPALEAGPGGDQQPATGDPRRPWWQFWRRGTG